MITDLVESKRRNDQIVDLLYRFYQTERQTIVMSERRNHLTLLQSLFLDRYGPSLSTSIKWGMKGKSKKNNELSNVSAIDSAKIIFTTYPMSSEGLDIPTLSVAVFASPKKDVVQASARIMRTKDASLFPIIIDFDDTSSSFLWKKSFQDRLSFYNSENFLISYK
jgi:superfamily II DNA or RNA helicase